MCGIVGYVGQQEAAPILLDGLRRLEYRGYDSAGIAVCGDGQLRVKKSRGADKLLGDVCRVLALIVAGRCRDEDRLMNLGFKLIEFERSVIVR